MEDKKFVLIDCDTGNDDAWAIISLIKAEEKCNLKIIGKVNLIFYFKKHHLASMNIKF